MRPLERALLISSCLLILLSACDAGISESSSGVSGTQSSDAGGSSGSGGGGSTTGGLGGSPAGPSGSKDTVTATASVGGTLSVAVGSSETISVIFNSSDGRPIRGLAISDTTLPAGWSGIDDYSCTQVGSGSSCIVNLTYSPTAVATGTLDLNYIYIDNSNDAQTPGATVVIPYAATSNNNVIASAAPTGEISASLNAGAATVVINFTTDDGNAATALSVISDLTALPTGWTAGSASFSCAIVSTGSGCQLLLNYTPNSVANGTLVLAYTYIDDGGASRSSSLNIPYSTTTAGNVLATWAPGGQINAIQKTGQQGVTITFTTDDARPASSLQLQTSLKSLPAGWSSKSSALSCGSVSTGNGCQLTLTYAPVTPGRGTLVLLYDYIDATGTYSVGSVNVPYASTTNDNVVGTAAPSGQINAIVGMGSQPVSVTFTTDDARPATALQLTSDLTALPGGWSSLASSFGCSGLASGSGCQLALMYTPAAAGTGTLALTYSYINNAGQAKTGAVDIPYRSTTDDNVVATPSTNPLSLPAGSSAPITVTFTTDDGNPATALAITSGLSALPAGWTSTSGAFTCATLSIGTSCQLALTYAPTMPDMGTLSLGFSYTNNAGMLKSGTVSISYTATP
ncbi:MAG TPA: hypothetical protein VFB37_08180 [Steroidobacteraceae bacterium]|nr:hypothetical protein [Steroidobacteraceae bacterium]